MAAQLHLVAAELAAHVRAGRSLAQAIADASEELPQPAASALSGVSAAVSLGTRPEQALGGLCDGEDVGLLAAAVGLQARVGGDLALLLDGLSETLVERRAQRRAAEVATAQARTTGRMVSAMPVVGVLALRAVDRPAFDLLVGTWTGWGALAVSAMLTLVGQHLIRRLGEVEP